MRGLFLFFLGFVVFLSGCGGRSPEYVPIMIGGTGSSAVCNCTIDRDTIYSYLTDYSTTAELANIFHPLQDQTLNTTSDVKFSSINITGNNIYVGSSEIQTSIYFYEDGSLSESFVWDTDADDKFRLSDDLAVSDSISAGGAIIGSADIYTTSSGGDLWIGNATESSARFRGYATGILVLNTTTTATTCTRSTEGAILYNQTIKKHVGCNGTAWNALY